MPTLPQISVVHLAGDLSREVGKGNKVKKTLRHL